MKNYYEFPELIRLDTGRYQLVGRLRWRTINVHEGFITDGASVPRLLQWIVPPWGNYQWAAIIHDHLLRVAETPKTVADKLFLLAMEDADMPWLFRHTLYWAVRIFGSPAPIPERG